MKYDCETDFYDFFFNNSAQRQAQVQEKEEEEEEFHKVLSCFSNGGAHIASLIGRIASLIADSLVELVPTLTTLLSLLNYSSTILITIYY